MKYTHFDDILPKRRTGFVMLYFAAMRTMRKLEAAIRKTNAWPSYRPPSRPLTPPTAQVYPDGHHLEITTR